MPMFDYKCTECGEIHEKIVKSADIKEIECPKCGKPAIQMISASNTIFSGSGWAKDGYTSKA